MVHAGALALNSDSNVEKRSNGQAIYRRHEQARDTWELHSIIEGRKTHWLCSETATYISSGEGVKGNDVEDKRNKQEQSCVSGRLIEQ